MTTTTFDTPAAPPPRPPHPTAAPLISIQGGTKVYRRFRKAPERALNNLTIDVPEGGVFGFLGPNGSGKTTTIRLLLGLISPTAGTFRVFGQPIPGGLPNTIPQIGSLVELPTMFPHFSGRENLRLLATASGIPHQRVDECLDIVGLSNRRSDKVKGYSLGMRQRLGIAAAMLKRPRLLILDEPTNGLDPAGIREVRDLIATLGRDGHTTVFLSSHLLGEVQQVCDRVAILNRGTCVANGLVSEVLASRGPTKLRVRVAEPSSATQILSRSGYPTEPDTQTPGALLVTGAADGAQVTRALADSGLYVSELTPLTVDLETVFLELTGTGMGAMNSPTPPPSFVTDSTRQEPLA